MNYLLHQLGLKLDEIEAAHLLNWHVADSSAVAVFKVANVRAGCMQWHDSNARQHTFIDNDGETIVDVNPGAASLDIGGAGVSWQDEADTPNNSLVWVASAARADITSHYEQAANPERLAVSNSAAGQVAWSASYGIWQNSAPTGVVGVVWASCEYGNGRWIIGGAAGAMAGALAPGGAGFSVQVSGLPGEIIRIRSNRRQGSAHSFLALDDAGNVSVSDSTGSAWTATLTGALGLTSTLEDITWDAAANRWTGIQYNGYRAWSDDGITWTESATAQMENFAPSANNIFHLDADDQGHLLLAVNNPAVNTWIMASKNSGDPTAVAWRSAFRYPMLNFARVAIYGDGRGIACGPDGIIISDRALTTRGEGA
jgi:hypothetical protein